MKNIYIGTDHSGKNHAIILNKHLSEVGFNSTIISDLSPTTINYPEVALSVANKVNSTNGIGILICGTGVGMSIVANKVKNIRAGLCYNPKIVHLLKEHNDCNVLCLGARVVTDINLQIDIVRKFLEVKLEKLEERHLNRLLLINKIECENFKNN